MAAGNDREYARGRQYSAVQKALVVRDYIMEHGRVNAKEVAAMAGCSVRHAYNILGLLSELMGLYEEGPYYVRGGP